MNSEPTLNAMKAERDELEEQVARMKGQIETAKADRNKTGHYADPTWWAKVNGALRHANRRLQKLNRDIGERNRLARAAEGGAFAARFVEAAKRRLKPETFKAIAEEAKESAPAQEAAAQ